jgi:hypothetical protein
VDVIVAPLDTVVRSIDRKLSSTVAQWQKRCSKSLAPDASVPCSGYGLWPMILDGISIEHREASGVLLTVAEELFDVATVMKSDGAYGVRGVDLEAMPVFTPLLQPATVCGDALAAERARADSSPLSQTVWNRKRAVAAAIMGNRCVKPPYKALLQRALAEFAEDI